MTTKQTYFIDTIRSYCELSKLKLVTYTVVSNMLIIIYVSGDKCTSLINKLLADSIFSDVYYRSSMTEMTDNKKPIYQYEVFLQ